MGEIKGIYAAAVSVINNDLSLDVNKTAKHCENIINDGCHGVVRPAISLERKGKFRSDVKRITQTIAEEMEFLIRKAPEQWHLMQPNWPSDSESEKGRV